MDLVLKEYRLRYRTALPVDAWSIHAFILNEKRNSWGAEIPPGLTADTGQVIDVQDNDNIELFKQQILLFRKWMFDRGYRNAPLYVTEYGVLMPDIYGFTMERVNAYMNKTFDFMLNTVDAVYGYPADGGRLVQRFSWYSTADKFRITGSDISGFNGYLYDPDAGYQSTAMGDNYAAYTARLAEVTDPIAVNLVADPATPLVSDGVATIQLDGEDRECWQHACQADLQRAFLQWRSCQRRYTDRRHANCPTFRLWQHWTGHCQMDECGARQLYRLCTSHPRCRISRCESQ